MNGARLERAAVAGDERVFEMTPPARPRVVGPGRREREYRERIDALECAGREAAEEREHLARELDLAQRIERGSQRRLDRLEERLDGERKKTETAEQAQKRLLVALGALQRENELLRERVATLQAASAPRLAAPKSSWLARLRRPARKSRP